MVTNSQQVVRLPVEDALCTAAATPPRFADLEPAADPELAASGWQQRFVTDLGRLAEYQELYATLGLEVKAEIVRPEQIGPECADCRLIVCRQFVTIYTRQRQGAGGEAGY